MTDLYAAGAEVSAAREKMMGKFKKKNTGKDSKPGSRKPESGRSPGKKEKRHWGVNENVTQEDMDALDYSKNKQNDEKELAEAQ